MESSIRQDFALGVCLDNGLLIASIAAREQIPQPEILSLAAAAQAIYLTATLESRGLDQVKDCRELWGEVSRVFDELCGAWSRVDSNDLEIRWLRSRLSHYRELAKDRVEMFTITTKERLEHVKTRDSEIDYSFSQRHDLESRGESEHSTPQHTYTIGHF